MKCFYHSADLDGMCSGAIVKMAQPECELIGINYGEPFPWDAIVPGERVYMVDFSLQPFDPHMLRLAETADLVWIDHHKSALEEWEAVDPVPVKGVREVGRAGCELSWSFFFPDEPMPRAVHLLGRYDVWDHQDPDVLPFQFGMRLLDMRPEKIEAMDNWRELLEGEDRDGFEREMIQYGEMILKYQEQQNKRLMGVSFDTELDGLRCLAVNAGGINSKAFESALDPERHDACLAFRWMHGSWTVSLYSDKPDVDVSAVAKARGGGGHAGAAGFQCDVLPFELG